MIRTAAVVISLAGLASSAFAQNFELSIVLSSETADTSGGSAVVTATVYGDADVGTHMLGGSFSVVSNSANVVDMTWTPAGWSVFNTDGGYAGEGNYNLTNYGQLWPLGGIFPPPPQSALGSAIGSFEITLTGIGEVQFDLVEGTPFTLETVDEYTGVTFQSSNGNVSLSSATVTMLPSPGAFSVLGLGGLFAARRRR
ncbi:MAG: hypothetical protein ACF8MF_01615 [Phycisphaerales bacterium JB052]